MSSSFRPHFDRALVALLVFTALVSGFSRFYRLGDSVFRADELNRYLEGRSPVTLVEYWKTWKPTNQIPFQNVLCMGVARLFPEVNEFSLRFIGALIGILTVLLLVVWLYRQYGIQAAILGSVWFSLHPYHLHESREAYYYGLLIFASSLFTLLSLLWLKQMHELKKAPGWSSVLSWLACAYFLCLTHMSAWIYAMTWAAGIIVVGFRGLNQGDFRRLVCRLGGAGLLLLILMSRWIGDALGEIRKVKEVQDFGFIGDRFVDVLPRVLPMYMGGVNAVGWGLLTLAVASMLVIIFRAGSSGKDSYYRYLSIMSLVCALAMVAYIGGVGGGVAKETFFSPVWPLLVLWATASMIKAAQCLLPGRVQWVALFFSLVLAIIFARPAWALMNLDGKPTPYRQIAESLDRTLPPGSVVVVDRWYEPWVEMSLYPPTNAIVTFTVPDEPFRVFIEGSWRDRTRRVFEEGQADAFLRLTRNHEEMAGKWDWPEQYFDNVLMITNREALWLRNSGYSVLSGVYAANTNRVVAHLFYNTEQDLVRKARTANESVVLGYGEGWGYMKPWRFDQTWLGRLALYPSLRNAYGQDFQKRSMELLQLLWVQAGSYQDRGRGFDSLGQIGYLPSDEVESFLASGQWTSYRDASPESAFVIVNMLNEPATVTLKVAAISLAGTARVVVQGQAVEFPSGLMVDRMFTLTVHPGKNFVSFAVENRHLVMVMSAQATIL